MVRTAAVAAATLVCTACLSTDPEAGTGSESAIVMFDEPIALDQSAMHQDMECTGVYDVNTGNYTEQCGPGACRFALTDVPPCKTGAAPTSADWISIYAFEGCRDGSFDLSAVSVDFRRLRGTDVTSHEAESGTVQLRDCSGAGCTVVLDVATPEGDHARGTFVVTQVCK